MMKPGDLLRAIAAYASDGVAIQLPALGKVVERMAPDRRFVSISHD